jgi:hypothetical protein
MKTMRRVSVLLALPVLALAFAAFAQDASPTPTIAVATPDASQVFWVGLITAITPAVLMMVKSFAPKIPKRLIPFLAPVVGVLAAGLTYVGASPQVSLVVGAFAGLAGVGLREAFKASPDVSPKTAGDQEAAG